MKGNLVVNVGKSNKMFKVERPGIDMRSFFAASRHLSEYIYYTILGKRQSIWIAQRNGRTKDGIDRTDPGIINMFTSGSNLSEIQALEQLSLQPVCVSYEWEPCDVLKAIELCRREAGPYVKVPDEDFNSIKTGLLQPKGHVRFHICEALTPDDLAYLPAHKASAFRKGVAELVDRRICQSYALFPNNYIAHDMLHSSEKYSSFYRQEDKERFIMHLAALDAYGETCDPVGLRRHFLGIYANPVDSHNLFCK